jgi:Dockerin type I domain/PKD domain/RTX calcium-binding nonapeptide repeat (4 copies)
MHRIFEVAPRPRLPVTALLIDPALQNDLLQFRFDLDNDGIFDTLSAPDDYTVTFVPTTYGANGDILSAGNYYRVELTHSFGDDGQYEIPMQIDDGDGGVTDVLVRRNLLDAEGNVIGSTQGNLIVHVLNGDPTIETLTVSATSITENEAVTVSGTYSDPAFDLRDRNGALVESFTGIATWSDGVSTDLIVSADGTFSTTRFFADDDPSGTPSDTFSVDIQIYDDDGGVSFDEVCSHSGGNDPCDETTRIPHSSGPILVNNVNPKLTALDSDASSLAEKSSDKVVNISGSFSDIGTLDTHVVVVDWGDGTPVQALGGANLDLVSDTFTATHTYARPGIYAITVTVTDDDTGTATKTTSAVLEGVGVVDGTLYIIGTNNRDHVHLRLDEKKNEFKVDVKLNQGGSGGVKPFKQTFVASQIERVVAFLCGGNDHFDGGSDGGSDGGANFHIPQIVFGGDGNDKLHGSAYSDALFGGAGIDDIKGSDGNDLLVGGRHRDSIKGGGGDDLQIGGWIGNDFNDPSIVVDVQMALTAWQSKSIVTVLAALGQLHDDGVQDHQKGDQGRNTIYNDLPAGYTFNPNGQDGGEGESSGPLPTSASKSSGQSLGVAPVSHLSLNSRNRLDVNNDGLVSPIDALLIINQLNNGRGGLPLASNVPISSHIDVNGDGLLTPSDALRVINHINANRVSNTVALANSQQPTLTKSRQDTADDFVSAVFFDFDERDQEQADDELIQLLSQEWIRKSAKA